MCIRDRRHSGHGVNSTISSLTFSQALADCSSRDGPMATNFLRSPQTIAVEQVEDILRGAPHLLGCLPNCQRLCHKYLQNSACIVGGISGTVKRYEKLPLE